MTCLKVALLCPIFLIVFVGGGNGSEVNDGKAEELMLKYGNGTDYVNISGFLSLLRATFHGLIKEADLRDVFSIFDRNRDSALSKGELTTIVTDWLSVLQSPKVALVVIDVQNDFINGNLSISSGPSKQNGSMVIPAVNYLTANIQWDAVVLTKDWHPANHISFYDSLQNWSHSRIDGKSGVKMFDRVQFNTTYGPIEQILWPKHCVQESWGAEFPQSLIIPVGAEVVLKGFDPQVDSYSAFSDNQKIHHTQLHSYLQSKGITHVFLCGLAYDYCVAYSAYDSLSLGYCTAVIEDCTKGLDMREINRVKEKIYSHNGLIISLEDTDYLVTGREIHWKWGLAVANKLKKLWGPPVSLSASIHYHSILSALLLCSVKCLWF